MVIKVSIVLKKIGLIFVILVILAFSLSKCAVFDLIDINVNTPQYPHEDLPLYSLSKVLYYDYESDEKNVYVHSGTEDDMQTVINAYEKLFRVKSNILGLNQITLEDGYIANGRVNGFSFFIQVQDSSVNDKVSGINSIIKTDIHFFDEEEIKRQQVYESINADETYIYNNPYIVASLKLGDSNNIYFEMINYKLDLIDTEYYVELYINNQLYATQHDLKKVKVPIEEVNNVVDIKMIAKKGSNIILSVAVDENFLLFDASSLKNLDDLFPDYVQAKSLFVINSDNVEDISALNNFGELKTLYISVNEQISDYSPIIQNNNLTKLFIENINNQALYEIITMDNLKVLSIKNSEMDIQLNSHFENSNVVDLQIANCHNVIFNSEYEGSLIGVERLMVNKNYSLHHLEKIDDCPNIRILELNDCDYLTDVFSLSELANLNMLRITNSIYFDLTQPMDNLTSLVKVNFENNPMLGSSGSESLNSIAVNDYVKIVNILNCSHYSDVIVNNMNDK